MGRFETWVRSIGSEPDPRFTLANERTFLSWMTMSLGLLGVGLAVDTILPDNSWGVSLISALWVLLAAVLAARSFYRWFRVERAMRNNEALPLSSSIPLVAFSVAVLALVSGAMVLAAI